MKWEWKKWTNIYIYRHMLFSPHPEPLLQSHRFDKSRRSQQMMHAFAAPHTYKDSTNIQSTCKSGAWLNESSPPPLPELACALFNDTSWVACKSISLSWVKTTQHQTAWLFIRVPAWHANRPQYEASSMQQCVFGLVANVFLVVLRNKAAERCGG